MTTSIAQNRRPDAETFARVVLAAADELDAAKFVAFFAEGARFRFAGMEPVYGQPGIRAAVAGFWSAANIVAMRHELLSICTSRSDAGEILSVEAEVEYTQTDGKVTVIPTASILRLRGDTIADYRILGDVAPLFAQR